jgi:hypothetical protein
MVEPAIRMRAARTFFEFMLLFIIVLFSQLIVDMNLHRLFGCDTFHRFNVWDGKGEG